MPPGGREAGVENVEFEVADAQTAEWDPVYDYAFSRMGTQFFAAPVPAIVRSAARSSPAAGCARSAGAARTRARSGRRPSRSSNGSFAPRGVRGRHLRARAILARQPRHTARDPRGSRVRRDRAAPARLRLLHGRGHGGGGRLPARDRTRRRADPPERRVRGEPAGRDRRGPKEHYAAWQRPDGSIVGRGSVWIVAATNPASTRSPPRGTVLAVPVRAARRLAPARSVEKIRQPVWWPVPTGTGHPPTLVLPRQCRRLNTRALCLRLGQTFDSAAPGPGCAPLSPGEVEVSSERRQRRLHLVPSRRLRRRAETPARRAKRQRLTLFDGLRRLFSGYRIGMSMHDLPFAVFSPENAGRPQRDRGSRRAASRRPR